MSAKFYRQPSLSPAITDLPSRQNFILRLSRSHSLLAGECVARRDAQSTLGVLQVFLEVTWMHAVRNTLCGCRFVVQIMFRRLTPGARRPVRPMLEFFCFSTVDYDAHLGVVRVRFLPLGDARHAYT